MSGQALDYRFGTPSLEEWHGLWKLDEFDGDVTEDEFYKSFKSLHNWISQFGKSGTGEDCDFFVVGDCHGDKSQCLEMVNPYALTMDLLYCIQKWLKTYYPNWRVIIPTLLEPHNVIIVYQHAFRANKEYEQDLRSSLNSIRDAMLGLDAYKHVGRK
jgi:hypothetical protein